MHSKNIIVCRRVTDNKVLKKKLLRPSINELIIISLPRRWLHYRSGMEICHGKPYIGAFYVSPRNLSWDVCQLCKWNKQDRVVFLLHYLFHIMLTQLYNNNNNRSINSNNNVNGPLGQHQKHNRKQYKLSYIVPTNFF